MRQPAFSEILANPSIPLGSTRRARDFRQRWRWPLNCRLGDSQYLYGRDPGRLP